MRRQPTGNRGEPRLSLVGVRRVRTGAPLVLDAPVTQHHDSAAPRRDLRIMRDDEDRRAVCVDLAEDVGCLLSRIILVT